MKYKVCYSLFQVLDGKISSKNHFSNCVSEIEGETFDLAVENFKKDKLNEGWAVGFIVEGDSVAEITFYDK